MRNVKRTELKRTKLIGAARDMFRERGVEQSTIAAIAERAQVPAGGVFYHFPSKDALLEAVTEDHMSTFSALLSDLDRRYDTPRKRLEAFLAVTETLRDDRARLGCPIAGLVQDVMRDGAQDQDGPSRVFRLFLDWLERQFSELGLTRAKAKDAATHVFCGVQGAFLLAFALRDPELVSREVRVLKAWLKGMAGNA